MAISPPAVFAHNSPLRHAVSVGAFRMRQVHMSHVRARGIGLLFACSPSLTPLLVASETAYHIDANYLVVD